MNTATTFVVSWNCTNFLIQSYIFLPYLHAVTIELNESSSKTTSAASFAISVPLIPIAKPTCAWRKAGASFVPSPVTATILPNSLSPKTRMNLSSGDALAITFNLLTVCLNASLFLSVIFIPSLSFSLLIPPQITLKISPSKAIGFSPWVRPRSASSFFSCTYFL